jgi:asparagine synthase (glutamine-hydrolysing)
VTSLFFAGCDKSAFSALEAVFAQYFCLFLPLRVEPDLPFICAEPPEVFVSAICGIVRFNAKTDIGTECAHMMAALAEHGLDGSKIAVFENIALGYQQFNAGSDGIDDPQPSVCCDGRYVFVADIYLHQRETLISWLGYTQEAANSLSDARLFALAFERWGEGAFVRIYGRFAVAIYDLRDRRLILARDPTMQRPLFYYVHDDFIAFASLPHVFAALPHFRLEPNEALIAAFLSCTVRIDGDESFYKDVKRVTPGHYSLAVGKKITSIKYWQPSTQDLVLKDRSEYIDAVRHHLDKAVKEDLRGIAGDVPSMLSSGLDSSAVTTTAARLLSQESRKVIAYTSAPRHREALRDVERINIDESALAAKTAAQHPNIRHKIIHANKSAMECIETMFGIYGTPIPNPCNLGWLESIYDDMRAEGKNVLLGGFMGNIVFSDIGDALLAEQFSSLRLRAWIHTCRLIRYHYKLDRTKLILNSIGPYLPGIVWNALNFGAGSKDKPNLVHSVLSAKNRRQVFFNACSYRSIPDHWGRGLRDRRAGILDCLKNLAMDAAAVDKAVLGHWKIELRDPTANREFIEFLLHVPSDQVLYNGVYRSLTLQALTDRVPMDVLKNQKYGLQAADWFVEFSKQREAVVQEIKEMAAFRATRDLFDVKAMQGLAEHWPSDWQDAVVTSNYRGVLLKVLSYARFIRRAYEAGDMPASRPAASKPALN